MSQHQTMDRSGAAERPERLRAGRAFRPAVDILERSHEYVLTADMPGVTQDNLHVTYERGELTIHGVVQRPAPEKGGWLVREYGVGDWRRVFQVGEGIDVNGIEASLRDGVLKLRLPKTPDQTPRKIAIKQG